MSDSLDYLRFVAGVYAASCYNPIKVLVTDEPQSEHDVPVPPSDEGSSVGIADAPSE